MKKTLYTLLILLIMPCSYILGQIPENLKGQFLDEEFQVGKIILKDSESLTYYLNYHLPSDKACFITAEGEFYFLANLKDITLITFGERAFIPLNHKNLAEVLQTYSDGSQLLLQRIAKEERTSENTGVFGTSTETVSKTNLSAMPLQHRYVYFEPAPRTGKVDLNLKFTYLQNNKSHTILRVKSLKKIFPEKWVEIQEYSKTNKPSFKNPEDIIELMNFCIQK